ncbi:MAG: cell division ATPase MinD [Candidatus Nanoarchaeia archaeon]|nr:cell division ATPase MinD [Candidatus Nanoarchaeia archaeon]
MAKVYAILSGKGGVGKTTCAVNLGACFNDLGHDVIIIDSNLTTPNVGIHLGSPIVPITLNHVLNGQARFEDAVYEHESGTKIIPASLSLKESESVDYRRLSELTRKLKRITEIVFMDSAAGLGEEARASMEAADEIIIVTNPEMTAVTDALKAIKLAEEMNKPVAGVIITRYRGKGPDMSIENIKDMLEIPILGIIPEDEAVKESHFMKNAVVHTHPKSRAAKHYVFTSKRLLGENVSFDPSNQGVFSRILIAFGLR